METRLAKKIASSFHRTTGLDFDDLYQEACRIYLEVESGPKTDNSPVFDPSKKSITSFAYWRMKMELINYCEKQKKLTGPMLTNIMADDEEGEPLGMDGFSDREASLPDHAAEVAQFLEQLEPDCRHMCDLVLNNWQAYAALSWKDARKCVREQLESAGWTKKRARDVLGALRKAVTQNLGGRLASRV